MISLEDFQGFQSCGNRNRISRQSARLVNRTLRRHHFHDLSSPPIGSYGQSTTYDLTQTRQGCLDGKALLGAARSDAKAADDLIENYQSSMLLTQLQHILKKSFPG